MEGPDPDMDRLLDDVNQRMNGYIKKVDAVEDPATLWGLGRAIQKQTAA